VTQCCVRYGTDSELGVQEMKWSLQLLARVLSEAPAALVGLSDRKGALREAMDADIVVWDPSAPANTSAAACQHRWKASPYRDYNISGAVRLTIVQGGVVYDSKKGVSADQMCGGAVLV
jgi:dihydroorotase-like cyclic amidohydrolase